MKFLTGRVLGRVLGAAVMALTFYVCDRAFGQTNQVPHYDDMIGFDWLGVMGAILGMGSALAVALGGLAGVRLVLRVIYSFPAQRDYEVAGETFESNGDGTWTAYDANGDVIDDRVTKSDIDNAVDLSAVDDSHDHW